MSSTTSAKRIALVTGGNAGYGYTIVELLAAADRNITVLVGCRSQERGDEAVKQLIAAGHANVAALLVDINDDKSVQAAAERIKSEFGGLDILINNAAVGMESYGSSSGSSTTEAKAPPAAGAAAGHAAGAGAGAGAGASAPAGSGGAPGAPSPLMAMIAALKVGGATAAAAVKSTPMLLSEHGASGPEIAEMAEAMFATNYHGTKRVSQALFPLLRPNARVVLNAVPSGMAYHRFSEPHLDVPPQFFSAESSIENLDAIAAQYIADHKAGKLEGWPVTEIKGLPLKKGSFTVYQMSKTLANGLTFIQARDNKTPGVAINACSPGQAATKLNGFHGPPRETGASYIVRAALLPVGAESGRHYFGPEAGAWA